MQHVYWVLEGALAGRPGPVEFPWDLTALRAAGLRVIVSLNSEPDPAEIAAAGLRHHSLPMTPALPVIAPLQQLLLRQLEPVLEAVHAEVHAGQPALIHCHAGRDRTGLALVAYLVRYHNLDIDEAISRLRSLKPTVMSTPGYEATARRFGDQEKEKTNHNEAAEQE